MKRKFFVSFPLTALVVMGAAQAGMYSTDFESFTLGDINGQDGWKVNATAGIVTPQYPGVVSAVTGPLGNPFGTKSAVVGFVDELNLTGSDVYVSHKYTGGNSTPLLPGGGNPNTTFTALFQIFDSVSTYSAGSKQRDQFGFRLQNAAGANLFSLIFTPYDQDPTPETDTEYNTFSWSTGTGIPTQVLNSPLVAAAELQSYFFNIAFLQDPFNVNSVIFSAAIGGPGGSSVFGGSLPGLAAEQIVEFGAFWKGNPPTNPFNAADPGSNYMVFDAVSLVPEPSAALLGLVGMSLVLVRRRRN